MTREEAIDTLKAMQALQEIYRNEAVDMAIEALKAEAEPQSEQYKKGFEDAKKAISTDRPTDLINRWAAIDAICKEWCYVTYVNCPHADDGFRCDGCDDVEVIESL